MIIERPTPLPKSGINSMKRGYPDHLFYIAFTELYKHLEYTNYKYGDKRIDKHLGDILNYKFRIPEFPMQVILPDGTEFISEVNLVAELRLLERKNNWYLHLKDIRFDQFKIVIETFDKDVYRR